MKTISLMLVGILSVFSAYGCEKISGTNPIDNSTVSALDLNRYLGTWYEIARYDHSFERGLVGCVANYSLREDGLIKVVNSGYKESLDGKYSESIGKARRPDDAVPGKLQVAFFLNFWGDYYVLELDPDYRFVLVGSKTDKYLWILSRTPKMEQEDLDSLLILAEERGYDLSKLIWVEQK